MIDEMFYNWDDDGVSHRAVGLIVRGRKAELVGSSHEAGCFAGGDETGIPFALIVKDKKLAAAASFGGAEAAGGVVKAEFESLFAFARAAVAGEDCALRKRKLVEQFLMAWRDQGHQFALPLVIEDRSAPIDDLGQSLGTFFRARHGPEDGVVERSDGFEDYLGVEPVGAVVFEGGGVDKIADGDDEDAGAGLGNPEPCIEKHRTDLVATLAQGLVEEAEILAAIGGEQADDVFQGDDGRLDGHFIEDPKPFPEQAAAGGGEAAHLAGEGKVLAGETGPDDIAVGDGGSADVLDGTEVEMVGAVVGGVAGGLLRANVVGPDRDACMPDSLGDKATARKEIDKGW